MPLFFLFLLLLPTQVAFHIWPSWSLVHGLPIDYLAPVIYLTDLLLLLLLTFTKSSFRLPLPLIIFAVLNAAFSIQPANTIFFWIRIFEYYWLYKYIITRPSSLSTVNYSLLLASLWTCVLALWQFFAGHTIGGIWDLFGEHVFNISTPLIATADFFGQRVLRAYATFPHPNALAGFLVICLFFVKLKNKYLSYFYYLLLTITLLVTFSRTAIITLVICIAYILFKNLKVRIITLISLLVGLGYWVIGVSDTISVTDRLSLQNHALSLIANYPLAGVGLGNFIPSLSATSNLQPVHNIFLLAASELGIPLTVCIGYLVMKKIKMPLSPVVIALIITGMFDHYWFTLHQNQLLLTVLLASLAVESKHARN